MEHKHLAKTILFLLVNLFVSFESRGETTINRQLFEQLGDPDYRTRESASENLMRIVRRTPPDAETLDYYSALREFGATSPSAEARARANRILGGLGSFSSNPWGQIACDLKEFTENHENTQTMKGYAMKLAKKLHGLKSKLSLLSDNDHVKKTTDFPTSQRLRYLVFPELREPLSRTLRDMGLTIVPDPTESDPGVFKARNDAGQVFTFTFYANSVSITPVQPVTFSTSKLNPYFTRAYRMPPNQDIPIQPVVEGGYQESKEGTFPYVSLSREPMRGPNGERGSYHGGSSFNNKKKELGLESMVGLHNQVPDVMESFFARTLLPAQSPLYRPEIREKMKDFITDYLDQYLAAGLSWNVEMAANFVTQNFDGMMRAFQSIGRNLPLPFPLSQLATAADDAAKAQVFRHYLHIITDPELDLRRAIEGIWKNNEPACNAPYGKWATGEALPAADFREGIIHRSEASDPRIHF